MAQIYRRTVAAYLETHFQLILITCWSRYVLISNHQYCLRSLSFLLWWMTQETWLKKKKDSRQQVGPLSASRNGASFRSLLNWASHQFQVTGTESTDLPNLVLTAHLKICYYKIVSIYHSQLFSEEEKKSLSNHPTPQNNRSSAINSTQSTEFLIIHSPTEDSLVCCFFFPDVFITYK